MGVMVKEARLRRRWTQAELADKAGCSLGYVRNVEQATSRSPSLFPMIDVARALELTLDEITAGKLGRVGGMRHHTPKGKAVVALPERLDPVKGKRLVISGPVADVRPAGNRPQVDINPVEVWEEE